MGSRQCCKTHLTNEKNLIKEPEETNVKITVAKESESMHANLVGKVETEKYLYFK